MPFNELLSHHDRPMRERNLARQEYSERVMVQRHDLCLDQFPGLIDHEPVAATYIRAGGFHPFDLLLEPFRMADIVRIHARYVFSSRTLDPLIQCSNKGSFLPLNQLY